MREPMRGWLLIVVLASLGAACTPRPTPTEPSRGPASSAGPAAIASPPDEASPAPRDGPSRVLAELEWQRTSLVPDPNETLAAAAAATAFGWVVVGTRLNIPAPGSTFAPGDDPLAHLNSGAIWVSADGAAWARVADGPELDGALLTTVVAHRGEALAFGRRGFCLPDACGGLPPNGGTIVWRSADGVRWERHDQTGLESGAVNDVVETAQGLIAVGFVADRQNKPVIDGVGPLADAAIWRSDDGLAWTEVAGLPVADGLQTIGVDGDRIVAIGTRGGETTVFWTSSDGGRSWAEASARGDFCCEVRAIGGSHVLTATHRDVIRAFDGAVDLTDMAARTWTSSAPAELRGIRPAAATWLGSSFVVLGFRNHVDADGLVVDDKPVAFSTVDGVRWHVAPLPAQWTGQTPIAVAATGHGTIVVLHALDSLDGPGRTTPNPVWFGH